jgi:hypothetical protein
MWLLFCGSPVKSGRLGELKWLISPKKISFLGDIRNFGEIGEGFGRPDGTLTLWAIKPGNELPGYFRVSLRDNFFSRGQLA